MFGTRSLFKQKPRGGSGGMSDEYEDRSAAPLSPLQEFPIMHCMPSHKILYGLGFGARSLTNLPTATRAVWFFYELSPIAVFLGLQVKQHDEMFSDLYGM